MKTQLIGLSHVVINKDGKTFEFANVHLMAEMQAEGNAQPGTVGFSEQKLSVPLDALPKVKASVASINKFPASVELEIALGSRGPEVVGVKTA